MTSIEWTDTTWNPVRGCTRISEGCRNCYAERMAARFSQPGLWGEGFAEMGPAEVYGEGGRCEVRQPRPRWTGRVELVPEKLTEPLRWRKPRRVFVNSTSDLFHEKLTDEELDRVFAAMALAPGHTFQILTKRPDRMRAYVAADRMGYIEHRARQLEREFGRTIIPQGKTLAGTWPWPHVWLGTSVEDQASADRRVPELLATTAAVLFLSCEPLLGPVRLDRIEPHSAHGGAFVNALRGRAAVPGKVLEHPALDWIIVGGESGPDARTCGLEWVRGIVEQCAEAGAPVFVKQLGDCLIAPNDEVYTDDELTFPEDGVARTYLYEQYQGGDCRVRLNTAKGGNPDEWPLDLRRREWPKNTGPAARSTAATNPNEKD